MGIAIRFYLAVMLLTLSTTAQASDWLKSPRPRFPRSALKSYSEGSVKVRIMLASDGTVRESKIVKSSGDAALDEAAQQAVLRWKIKPAAIRPSDLTKGREEIIEFRQEAPLAAVHPDRVGAFTDSSGKITPTSNSKLWMFAPFPSYPLDERRRYHEGTARIGLTIGQDGKPENIHLVKTSGYKPLDDAALRGVALWRAHKQYIGHKGVFPVTFVMGHRR